ncbi:NUDIX domain-containing protein [Desulfovibrio ferrophilus]|uniref:NUDIX hydrolase n=1 Tax=Desulfovibrio ferrophilus TaxID=241368 RepID=A0A2Z6AXY3_9BACT|nr:NUDIX hydrolase [Desulfovibrio ferrophilus]BBD08006.1 NUDIX hydrolase [Desulfovibrio ferrophilus]
MVLEKPCPHCGKSVLHYRNPVPTVDVVIFEPERGIVLIERSNPPHGWALPGGFVDYGETVEAAAIREALEETGLPVTLTGLLGVYSDPERDPRQHTLSVVYTARVPEGLNPQAGDDAARAQFFPLEKLPAVMAFDHAKIINDFQCRYGEVVPEM